MFFFFTNNAGVSFYAYMHIRARINKCFLFVKCVQLYLLIKSKSVLSLMNSFFQIQYAMFYDQSS